MVDLQKHRTFLVFLAAFALIQLFIVSMRWGKPLVWDSSVYVGMGKHLYSLGQIGLYESFRPPALPVFIGAVWKSGLFFPNLARILAVTGSTLGVAAVYKMAIRDFNRKIALYTALILMSSIVFMRWSHYFLTGIPAAILTYAAVHYAVNKKPVKSGLLVSLAFLTRFPAGLALPAAGLTLAMAVIPVKNIIELEIWFEDFKKLFLEGFKFGAAFSILPLTYFSLNEVYGLGFLSPILGGVSVPMLNPEKYLYGLYFFKEAVIANPLVIFAPVGIYYALRNREENLYGYLVGLVLFYSFFAFYPHKEPRFMLAFLPFLALFAAKGFYDLDLEFVREKTGFGGLGSKVSLLKRFDLDREKFLLVFTVLLLLSGSVYLYSINSWSDETRDDFLRETAKLNGTVAGLNPAPVVYGDFKFVAVRPEHYENTSERMFYQADYFVMNSCSWYCAPAIDRCEEKRDDLFKKLEDSEQIYENSFDECRYGIYELNQE